MTTVLRFSDFLADTFAEHDQILRQRGFVWWAWWKKQHEPFPSGSLDRLRDILAAGESIEVGLVNRSGVYLAAQLEDFRADGGELFKSPDARATPNYYRDQAFPAWFKFGRISEISRTAWEARFGPVPIGDETYFDNTSGELEILSSSAAEGIGSGILHISDLHFGSDYAFHPDGQFYHQEPLEVRISDALPCKPAGVVVSGDLTTRGSNDGLVSARLFLERLADSLDLPRERFVIVPGNHDILVNRENVTQDFANEQHFRTQLFEFHGSRQDLERVQEFHGADGVHYIVATLNSSRPRDPKTMDYGYVGRDRSEPILRAAADIRDRSNKPTWLVVVLHHHILPAQQIEYAVPERPASIAIDAGELVGIASDLRFDAILHGHEHVPFVGRTSRIAEFGGYNRTQLGIDRSIVVLAAGSTSVRVDRLTDEMRHNSFNYYEVSQDSLRVQMYQFTARLDPSVPQHWDFTVQR